MEIIFEHINKTFNSHQALSDVNLTIKSGAIFGLIGHNGAGKTTLLRILTQILKPDTGRITINGEQLSQKHKYRMGYLPEERGLYKKMSVQDYLIFIGKLHLMSRAQAIQKINVWLERMDLLSHANQPISSLSKGMQQKVQFIATVFFDPDLLILDEPFSGFDPMNVELIKTEILKLNASGVTLIFSAHQMESVEEICSDVGMLDRSELVLNQSVEALKAAYCKNRFFVRTETNLPKQYASQLEPHRDGYLIELSTPMSRQEFLLDSVACGLLEFKAYHPTLKEVFMARSTPQAVGHVLD